MLCGPPCLGPHFLGAHPPECITETHVALPPTTHKASWGASPAWRCAAAGHGSEGSPCGSSLPACWKQPSLPSSLASPPSSILSKVMSPQSVAFLGALIGLTAAQSPQFRVDSLAALMRPRPAWEPGFQSQDAIGTHGALGRPRGICQDAFCRLCHSAAAGSGHQPACLPLTTDGTQVTRSLGMSGRSQCLMHVG